MSTRNGWSTYGAQTTNALVSHCGRYSVPSTGGYWRCPVCDHYSDFASPKQGQGTWDRIGHPVKDERSERTKYA